MTRFRPCIDLHEGRVKQIVGGTLRDLSLCDEISTPDTNYISDHSAAWFAERYRKDNLHGGHVIMLGPGNQEAALEALQAWPQGMQVGGGITLETATYWLDAGAEKVIVTSAMFEENTLCIDRVRALSNAVGRDQLVLDLSCRRIQLDKKDKPRWYVAKDRWQTMTNTRIDKHTLTELSAYCSEFLVHAADVEGKCQGIDEALVVLLGQHSPIPCTYAGGGRHIKDLETIRKLSKGRIDLTYGSALDLFSGTLVQYTDCLAWNKTLAS